MHIQKLNEIKNKFRILSDWVIDIDNTGDYFGQVSISPTEKKAVLYPWHNSEEPKDFLIHELLHVAMRAFDRSPEETKHELEELLVQDICQLYSKI